MMDYNNNACSVLHAVLSTLYLLTYLILTTILRKKDYLISAPLLERKFRYREVKTTKAESYGMVKSRFKSRHSGLNASYCRCCLISWLFEGLLCWFSSFFSVSFWEKQYIGGCITPQTSSSWWLLVCPASKWVDLIIYHS